MMPHNASMNTPDISSHTQASSHDSYYMQLAINEAKKGQYTTRPNPAVGCVIVQTDMLGKSRLVGRGYHAQAGQPHAEVFALRMAGDDAKGATAYVTLEPCSHTGRTPPCASALIAAGIRRVVVASRDPNPQVSGRGIAMLEQAGVEVHTGVASHVAERLNLGFLKAMRTGMPYVRLKLAISMDGRIAMASGESRWITGDEAREDVQRLRAMSAAIITGSQTIINDDPKLTVRSSQLGVAVENIPQPKVVLLDRRQRLSAESPYWLCQQPQTLFWHSDDLGGLLTTLVSEYQCHDVLVESGASVAGSFLQAGLVDELVIYQAPCLLGQQAQAMVQISMDALAQQLRFHCTSHSKVGEDLRLVFQPL